MAFSWMDVIDILVVALILYWLIKILAKTRAIRVLIGLGVILILARIFCGDGLADGNVADECGDSGRGDRYRYPFPAGDPPARSGARPRGKYSALPQNHRLKCKTQNTS